MTQYTGIQGSNILIVSSDPANPVEGQIWYNTTSNLLKGYKLMPPTWTSSGSMPQVNTYGGGTGIQTAALAFGGNNGSGSPGPSGGFGINGVTQAFNGSSWTTGGLNPTGKQGPTLFGTQTAAIGASGYVIGSNTATTASYNGSSWAGAPSLNIARQGAASVGIQTAALVIGGSMTPPNARVESYNGSTWTNVNSLNNGREGGLAASGIQAAALGFGGYAPPNPPGISNQTESWNGSTWTTVNAMVAGQRLLAGFGTQTLAVAAGGNYPNLSSITGQTQIWNGTDWSISTPMVTARYQNSGAGSQTAGVTFGGGTPSATGATELWTGTTLAAKTITTS